MGKVRATRHNGRKGKDGVFKAGHNDRTFKVENAEHFGDSIDAQNDRHIKSRHKERIRSVGDILKNPKTCPEETVYQLGTKDGHEDGRMIEVYLVCSVAPIPFATVANREWGSIGTNYFKSLFALAFQGFFIMVCVGIYAVLINSMTISDDVHMALFSIMAYTIILCYSLFHTGSLSKSIFNAH